MGKTEVGMRNGSWRVVFIITVEIVGWRNNRIGWYKGVCKSQWRSQVIIIIKKTVIL